MPGSYFDAMYAEADDPWSFETSEYERDKYAATIDALPRARYRAGFEIGCSVGVLTAQLAQRCQSLLSVDVARAALERAQDRCRHLPGVRFELMSVPNEFPKEVFDLEIVSEVAYYWSLDDLARAAGLLTRQLEPGGNLVLVHFTPFVEDYPLTGDQVHEWFLGQSATNALPLRHLLGTRADRYRLDLFQRQPDPV